MSAILKHELLPLPVSLAQMDRSLRSGDKAVLAKKLINGITSPCAPSWEDKSSCLVIDGQAVVVAIGLPKGSKTFGDLGNAFFSRILHLGANYDRIDIVFDRYYRDSINAGTRKRRTKGVRPIRRVVESDVPLPASWPNFLSLPTNKADLARFLCEEFISNAPNDKENVVAGGFDESHKVQSSQDTTDISLLAADHEEAETNDCACLKLWQANCGSLCSRYRCLVITNISLPGNAGQGTLDDGRNCKGSMVCLY